MTFPTDGKNVSIVVLIASFQLRAATKPRAEIISVTKFSLKALVNLETSLFSIMFLFCIFQSAGLGKTLLSAALGTTLTSVIKPPGLFISRSLFLKIVILKNVVLYMVDRLVFEPRIYYFNKLT